MMDEIETTVAERETAAISELVDETPPPRPETEDGSRRQRRVLGLIAVGGVVGGIGAVALAPVALAAAGFGTAGVVAGSVAAAAQSSIGSVAAGSVFASLQSAGVLGFAATTNAGIGAGVGGITAGITGWFTRRRNNNGAGPAEGGTGTDGDNGEGDIGNSSGDGSSDSMEDSKKVKNIESNSVMQGTQTDFELLEDRNHTDRS